MEKAKRIREEMGLTGADAPKSVVTEVTRSNTLNNNNAPPNYQVQAETPPHANSP